MREFVLEPYGAGMIDDLSGESFFPFAATFVVHRRRLIHLFPLIWTSFQDVILDKSHCRVKQYYNLDCLTFSVPGVRSPA